MRQIMQVAFTEFQFHNEKTNAKAPDTGDLAKANRVNMKRKIPSLLAISVLLAPLVNTYGHPPITTEPQDQTNYVSSTAIFWVAATGTGSGRGWSRGGESWCYCCRDHSIVRYGGS